MTDLNLSFAGDSGLHPSDFAVSLVLDNISDMVVLLDDEGRILHMNRRGIRLSGYTGDSAAGRGAEFLFFHRELNASSRLPWLSAHATSEQKSRADVPPVEVQLQTASGETVPVDLRIVSVRGGGFFVFATDLRITRQLISEILEREFAVRRLEVSESKFSRLFVFNPSGILIAKTAGWIINEANPAAAEIFERPEKEICGRRIGEIGLTPLDMTLDEFCGKVMMEGNVSEVNGEVLLSGRVKKRVRISAVSFDMEEADRIILSISDITESEKLRTVLHRQERLESIGTMAGILVHDFNNMLGVILGHAGLMRMRPRDAEDEQSLSQIENACMHGRELSQRLMSFSPDAAGDLRPCDLRKIVQECAGLSAGRRPGLRISVFAPETLRRVYADKGQLVLAVDNLLANAADAMNGAGEVKITFSEALLYVPDGTIRPDRPVYRAQSDPRDFQWFVRMDVRDYGPGIPPEDLDLLFDPFFTTKPGGNGLGLPSVYAVLRNQHGAVFAGNAEDGGAVFTLYIPAVAPENAVSS